MFEVYFGPAPGAFVTPIAFANVTITDSDLPCEWSFTLCITLLIATSHMHTHTQRDITYNCYTVAWLQRLVYFFNYTLNK